MSADPVPAVICIVLLGLLVHSTPTPVVPGADPVAPGLIEKKPESDCPSCALAQVRKNSSYGGGQTDMVEAVKQHILNMLHLNARPNLTQPVPRAAMLNAIKKLHVGRVADDGSVDIQDKEADSDTLNPPEPPSEIITFAEPGDSPNQLTFDIAMEGSSPPVVEQANVWIFLKLAKGNRAKGKVKIQLLQRRSAEEERVSEKMVDTRRSGWHTLAISHSVQALLDNGDKSLSVRVSCPLCSEAGATPMLLSTDGKRTKEREESHRPFLVVVLQTSEAGAQRRSKRGLECDGKINLCCKRQFYVNFRDIGWSDWIIAPAGYHANYCEGECPSHMASISSSSLSFHSTVINHYRMRGFGPFQNLRSCCVPTRLRAMSMLYYNEEQKIIKKDIQNMIVDECGCS